MQEHSAGRPYRGAPMADADGGRNLLAQVIERFPGEKTRILRLALKDPAFRALCEDYVLAQQTCDRFRVSPERVSELEEYRTIVAELEEEIQRFLLRGKNA